MKRVHEFEDIDINKIDWPIFHSIIKHLQFNKKKLAKNGATICLLPTRMKTVLMNITLPIILPAITNSKLTGTVWPVETPRDWNYGTNFNMAFFLPLSTAILILGFNNPSSISS